MSIEKTNENGDRCFGFGVNGNGRAECHWPECGCYPEAQQPAAAVPATAAECDFIGSFLDLFEDSEPNALIAKRALAKIKAALAQQPAAAVPEGYKVVLAEPTPEVAMAISDKMLRGFGAYDAWRAGVAAAERKGES